VDDYQFTPLVRSKTTAYGRVTLRALSDPECLSHPGRGNWCRFIFPLLRPEK
jgi:hypothetical protein